MRVSEKHTITLRFELLHSTFIVYLHFMLKRSFRILTAYNNRLLSPLIKMQSTSAVSKRTFPPLYVSQGDEAEDRLAFVHILERLKVTLQKSYQDAHLKLKICRHRNGRDG